MKQHGLNSQWLNKTHGGIKTSLRFTDKVKLPFFSEKYYIALVSLTDCQILIGLQNIYSLTGVASKLANQIISFHFIFILNYLYRVKKHSVHTGKKLLYNVPC